MSDLRKIMGKKNPYVHDNGSFNTGIDIACETMSVGEMLDRRIAAIEAAIADTAKKVEAAQAEQRTAQLRSGNAIKLGGRLRTLLHQTREARKAIGNV